jgi:hypothetical protein
MVDIYQIRVQIKMFIPAHLHGSIGSLRSRCTWWEAELGENAEGREVNEGDGLGGKFLLGVDEDLLNQRVRGLCPVRG